MIKGNKEMLSCMTEADLDTIEIELKQKRDALIANGDVETADYIEDTIKKLDHVSVCSEEDSARGFASMMRDRAR